MRKLVALILFLIFSSPQANESAEFLCLQKVITNKRTVALARSVTFKDGELSLDFKSDGSHSITLFPSLMFSDYRDRIFIELLTSLYFRGLMWGSIIKLDDSEWYSVTVPFMIDESLSCTTFRLVTVK